MSAWIGVIRFKTGLDFLAMVRFSGWRQEAGSRGNGLPPP